MSYDLYFTSKPPRSSEEFFAYFQSRPNYTLQPSQAWYANEDTGVYFSFELPPARDAGESPETEGEPEHWAAFNINLARPGFFALEAALELEAFAERFGGSVFDPQMKGLGEGEYSTDGFMAGWNHANRFGVAALSSGGAPPRPHLPESELRAAWAWNHGKNALQEALGESVFVPRISLFRIDGEIRTASVWADGIPVALPVTRSVLVYRDELAPRKLFRRKPDIAAVEWSALSPLLPEFREKQEPRPHFLGDYRQRPAVVTSWVRSLSATDGMEGLGFDEVLDTELLDAATR